MSHTLKVEFYAAKHSLSLHKLKEVRVWNHVSSELNKQTKVITNANRTVNSLLSSL